MTGKVVSDLSLALLPRQPDANGVLASECIHGGKTHRLGGILGENQRLPWRLVARGKTLLILEYTIDLNLDAAPFAVLHVRDNLKPAVRQGTLLEASARNRILRGLVEQHEAIGVLERELRCVQRQRAGLADATRAEREGNANEKGCPPRKGNKPL